MILTRLLRSLSARSLSRPAAVRTAAPLYSGPLSSTNTTTTPISPYGTTTTSTTASNTNQNTTNPDPRHEDVAETRDTADASAAEDAPAVDEYGVPTRHHIDTSRAENTRSGTDDEVAAQAAAWDPSVDTPDSERAASDAEAEIDDRARVQMATEAAARAAELLREHQVASGIGTGGQVGIAPGSPGYHRHPHPSPSAYAYAAGTGYGVKVGDGVPKATDKGTAAHTVSKTERQREAIYGFHHPGGKPSDSHLRDTRPQGGRPLEISPANRTISTPPPEELARQRARVLADADHEAGRPSGFGRSRKGTRLDYEGLVKARAGKGDAAGGPGGSPAGGKGGGTVGQ